MGQGDRPILGHGYYAMSSSANVVLGNEEDGVMMTPKVTKIENDYEDGDMRTEILRHESDNKSDEERMRIEDDEDPKQHEIDGK